MGRICGAFAFGTFLITALSSVSVSAQGGAQTVEGAQKFLSMVLPKVEIKSNAIKSGEQGAKDAIPFNKRRFVEFSGMAHVTNANSVSACVSMLTHDASNIRVKYTEPGSYADRSILEAIPDAGKMGGEIHWGKDVLSAKANGTSVDIQFREARFPSTLYLKDEALAKRVAYAIEFLRMNCDPTASTGF